MTWGRVGRSIPTSAVNIGGVSGAYAALDAVGVATEIPYAVGNEGGLLNNVTLWDRWSGLSGIRLHFFSQQPTTIANNEPFTVPSGQENNYLGSIDINAGDWVTAGITGGNTAFKAEVYTKPLILYGNPTGQSARSVWVQMQTPVAVTFGWLTATTAHTIRLGVLQD